MNWIFWLSLIEKVGFPLADKLWTMFQTGGTPTPEQWAELRKLQQQTPETQMRDALLRAGLNPDDPANAHLMAMARAAGNPVMS